MAKTNPIGVRFDKDLLEKLISEQVVKSPQKALNLFEKTYIDTLEKILDENKDEHDKVMNDVLNLGMSITKTDGDKISRIDPLSEEGLNLLEYIRIKEENSKILEQIKVVELEKIPSERNTTMGKQVWERDQSYYTKQPLTPTNPLYKIN